MFGLEVFAYGIFIFLGGGMRSPYIWYLLGCVLTMVSMERRAELTYVAVCWCIICAVAGGNQSLSDINTGLGVLMMIGCFYVIRIYIERTKRQSIELYSLNERLTKEKEISESALTQLTGLYETLNIFNMTDSDKILNELAQCVMRATASKGCIIMKLSGEVQGIAECGIEKNELNLLSAGAYGILERGDNVSEYITDNEKGYRAEYIGELRDPKGILIRKTDGTGETDGGFYKRLIEIVFNNLDINAQMEQYIALDEQNRIANELHDTVIQKLFGMVCSMKVMESENMDAASFKERIGELKRSAELTMQELRESIYGNRFSNTLNTFSETLRLYMEEVENLTGSEIDIHMDKDADSMSAAQKIAVYRVACEAVNNSVRHGEAKHIILRLSISEKDIELRVEDDGKGLEDKSSMQQHSYASDKGSYIIGGNGLRNMKKIALVLKGSFSIENRASGGTVMKLMLPV